MAQTETPTKDSETPSECDPADHFDPSGPFHPDDEFAPGKAGQFHVPEEYRELDGWEFRPHNSVRPNVSEFYGGHGEIDAWAEWTATRHNRTLASVALVGEKRDYHDPNVEDEMNWYIEREVILGTSSRKRNYKAVSWEGALEQMVEWCAENPSTEAMATFDPPREIESGAAADRFEEFFDETEMDEEAGIVTNDLDSAGLIVDESVTLPDGSAVEKATPINSGVELAKEEDKSAKYVGFPDGDDPVWFNSHLLARVQRFARAYSTEALLDVALFDADNERLYVRSPDNDGYVVVCACDPLFAVESGVTASVCK